MILPAALLLQPQLRAGHSERPQGPSFSADDRRESDAAKNLAKVARTCCRKARSFVASLLRMTTQAVVLATQPFPFRRGCFLLPLQVCRHGKTAPRSRDRVASEPCRPSVRVRSALLRRGSIAGMSELISWLELLKNTKHALGCHALTGYSQLELLGLLQGHYTIFLRSEQSSLRPIACQPIGMRVLRVCPVCRLRPLL